MLNEISRVGFNQLFVRKLRPNAILPTKAHAGDLGWDLYYCGEEPLKLLAEIRTTICLGVCCYMPGYGFLLKDRSGLAMKDGLTILGGVIDEGYRGEWCAIIHNTRKHVDYWVNPGDKICQAVAIPVVPGEAQWIEALPEANRGEGGFGSTGM